MLAVLVLRAGEIVAVERLIDELWSDDPPPSAAHTVEGYVSRLRGALQPFGPTIERRGGGYRLVLGGGSVDARIFASLVEDGAAAAAAGEHERAAALSLEGTRLWRGPALADVSLRAEADHLEELRLRALEQRFDAELQLGRHADVVAELRTLVGEHPHRERLVAQLMLALYRSGRHADALAAYEATRRSLADELGLQPSVDLQRLSGDIVRQDPALHLSNSGGLGHTDPKARRRWPLVAAIGLAAAAATAAGVGLIRADDRQRGAGPIRIVLLLHRAPTVGLGDPGPSALVQGLKAAERRYGVQTEWFVVPENNPKASTARAASERLRSNPVDLVIAPLQTIFSLTGFARLTGTRFVTLDVDWPVKRPSNTTAFVFDDSQSGYLVGYLSGLMERQAGPRLNPRHVVSLIGGDRVPTVERLLDSFTAGARRALPDITVLRSYSGDFLHQSSCDRIANEQIDRGADIVFPAAGGCGFGALSAARIRGVWGVGFDGDLSYLGRHILASTEKRYDQAVLLAVQSFLEQTLRPGGRVVLNLGDNAVGIAGINDGVPADVSRLVAHEQTELQRGRRPG